MKAYKLAGLKPEAFFAYFEKLCSIPHGSRNTKAISDYLVSFAKEHGLRYIQDAANNIIIFKDGSAGYEDREPLILQGHMDMVCQKDADCPIDMEKDPLDVTHDGKFVFARGTTLGADDGVAVAIALSVLADDTIAHPPLEVVITADEEIGLAGASVMDISMLKGRRMLNMDSLSDSRFTAGCAGGVRVTMEKPVQRTAYEGPLLAIELEALRGGHSGGAIRCNYANANKAVAALLDGLVQRAALRLVRIQGGTAGNAIPRSCQAVLAADGLDTEEVRNACESFLAQLKETYDEPAAVIKVTCLPAENTQAMTAESTEQVIRFLMDLPNGVIEWSADFENLPQTSLNLGVLETKENVCILTNIRSNVNKQRQELYTRLKEIAREHGCIFGDYSAYSAWEYRKDSPLRDAMTRIYEERFGKSPVVQVLHVGLECGVLGQKLPGLDCVSTGPNAYDVHTSRERLEIASVERFWYYLLDLLKAL